MNETYITRKVMSQLAIAQAEFADAPNSGNWRAVLKWMAAYQQLSALAGRRANPSTTVGGLAEVLNVMDRNDALESWPDAICKYATGMSAAEVASF